MVINITVLITIKIYKGKMIKIILTAVCLSLCITPATAKSANLLITTMMSHIGAKRPHGCPSRWCACYLDIVLTQIGFKPLGSFRAKDFRHYGKKAKPGEVGAIMVMKHHVGVVTGKCGNGRVQIISGNYSHRVKLGCYSISKAIAWRKPVR